jgi:hypothetical protein
MAAIRRWWNCPQDCPCDAPKQRLQSQPQPSRLIREVKDSEGFTRKIEGGREAGSRLANRCRSRSEPNIQFGRIDASRRFARANIDGAAILEKPVSDLGTLEDLNRRNLPPWVTASR